MSADITPIKPKRPAGPRFTREKLTELLAELDHARSAVFVVAQALDTGDERTDLEIHSARTLTPAFKAIEHVWDELVSLRGELPGSPDTEEEQA
jgi:hypothetical protein